MFDIYFVGSLIIFLSFIATMAEVVTCKREYGAIIFTADELSEWGVISKLEARIRLFVSALINPIFHTFKMIYWLIFVKNNKSHWRNIDM